MTASKRGKKIHPMAARLATSEARANFKQSLERAQLENAVIGFDRYGELVAALVPIDAVRMLAGRAGDVKPAVRAQIARTAQVFLKGAPAASPKPPRPKKGSRKGVRARGQAKGAG